MRILKIALAPKKQAVLPLAYNEYVQGMLYSCWHEKYPQLHDHAPGGAKAFRYFTFGRLEGKGRVDTTAKTIAFDQAITLEVRSVFEELAEELASQLVRADEVRIGQSRFDIVNLQTADRLLYPGSAEVRMRTPVTVHVTQDNGQTLPLEPSQPEFCEALQTNLQAKLQDFGSDLDPRLQIVPHVKGMRKQVTRFKGFWVTGWLGEFTVSAEPETLAFLYHVGLGARNSAGFGMFDIVDGRL